MAIEAKSRQTHVDNMFLGGCYMVPRCVQLRASDWASPMCGVSIPGDNCC